MQGSRNGNASGQAGVAEQRKCKAGPDSIPDRKGQQYADECAKWAALSMYNQGVASLGSVQRMFLRNPNWRRA